VVVEPLRALGVVEPKRAWALGVECPSYGVVEPKRAWALGRVGSPALAFVVRV
jgi:hypothetical protein